MSVLETVEKTGSLFRDEKGITTTAMAISIMLSLSLVFTGAQVCKATSASAEIQEVADACALAAESEVSEFMVCVKICDAALLSLGLLAASSIGLGLVCACVPPLQSFSSALVNIGQKSLKTRKSFADKAEKGLTKLQQALPFLAAAAAARVASENNASIFPADYWGCAFLVPQKGKKISMGSSQELEDAISDSADSLSEIQKKAEEAEECAKKAQKAKENAFKLDCGNSPGYCQYERAGRFSWMPSSENPMYASVDAWSFSVALERAKAYYAYREAREDEPVGSVKDKASYYVRMKFYAYAYEKLELEGYVNEGKSSFSANFPKLFRNTSEFRQTSLYLEAAFPVSREEESDKGIMHAWSGCPACSNVESYDLIAALDSGVYEGCETCNFSVESLGNVASASTNIANGFEYHYERIRTEAEKYEEAVAEGDPLRKEVEGLLDPLIESLKDALKSVASCRIEAYPCGSDGCVAIVVNKAENPSDIGFETLFAPNPTTLGARIAVSGSTLVEDPSQSISKIVSSTLDGTSGNGGAATGAARTALDLWGGLLGVYEKGQKGFEKAISSVISTLSLGTLTGLGDWAADAFGSAIESIGLAPANLNALRPVIINTGHVVDGASETFSVNFKKAREGALSASSSNGTVFSGLSAWISGKFEGVSSKEMTIAEIDFPIGDSKIPIQVAIPDAFASTTSGGIQAAIGNIESFIMGKNAEKVWQ